MIYEEHNYVLETDEAPPVLGLPPPPGWFYISSRCTHIRFCETKTGELVATCLFFNVKSKKQKKNLHYIRGITLKRVTNVGTCLRGLVSAGQHRLHSSAETSRQW